MILFALIALVFPVAFARADTMDHVFCGDLSQSDCQILLDNAAVMNDLNSFAVSLNMTLEADSAEPTQLSVQGYGEFELDDESLQTINEMAANTTDTEWGALAEVLLTSAKADVSIDMRENSGGEEVNTEFKLLLSDGVLVLSANALTALTGEDMTGMEGFGIDLNGAIGELLTESGAMPVADSEEMEEVAESAMNITRLADSEVSGAAVAVFRTDLDLNALFSLVSPEQFVAASNDMDDAQTMQEVMESLDVREFSVTQYVGLDDHHTYGTDLLVDMTMAFTDNGQQMDASINFEMSAVLSNFGEPVDVAIPEDAIVFPLAMLLQMGN